MPALSPAPLWVLLALWLCCAVPARGEYRAEGCCPVRPGPRTVVPAPAWPGPAGRLGRPFPCICPSPCEKAGLCPSEATWFPKVWTSPGPSPWPRPAPSLVPLGP